MAVKWCTFRGGGGHAHTLRFFVFHNHQRRNGGAAGLERTAKYQSGRNCKDKDTASPPDQGHSSGLADGIIKRWLKSALAGVPFAVRQYIIHPSRKSGVAVGDGKGVGLGDAVGVGVADGVGETEGVTEGDAVAVGLTVGEGVGVAVGVATGDLLKTNRE